MSTFIPDSSFIPDEAPIDKSNFIADSAFVPDDGLTDDQIVAKYQEHQNKYGSLDQQALAAAEGAARGLSLGASDFIASKLTSPEAVRGREEANPVISGASNIGGGAALIGLTGGLAAPAEAGLAALKVAPTAARALGYGLEGAVFGGANTVSDLALGDTNMTAEKVLMDVGFGASLGAGLGLLSKGLEALPFLKRTPETNIGPKEPIIGEIPVAEIPEVAAIEPVGAQEVIPTPKSLKEMEAFNENAQFMGQGLDEPPPKVEALNEALDRLDDLQAKPTELHKNNLLGKTEQDRNNALLKTSTSLEDTYNKYNNHIRAEVNQKTEKAIESIADGYKPTADSVANGEQVSSVLENQIIKEQKRLAPAFEELKKFEVAEPGSHQLPLINMFTERFPKLAEMFNTSDLETVKFNPWKSNWGISKEAYNAIKTVVKDSEDVESIQDLVNMRRAITDKIKPLESSAVNGQLKTLSSSMMDYINENVGHVLDKVPEGEGVLKSGEHIRHIFKDYAINEQNRNFITSKFGVDIENGGFKQLAGKPASQVLSKIFKDEEMVKAIRSLLPKEEYEKLVANYIAQAKDVVTKDGVLSSAKFGTFLNDKKNIVLNEAFKDMPAKLQRIRDLNTVSRLVPDLPSANPSGSANTVFELMKKLSSPTGIASLVKEKGMELLEKRAATEELNQRLSGRAQQAEKLGIIKKMVDKSSKKINDAAKSVYTGASRGAFLSGATKALSGDYSERVKRIKELSNDPNAMIQHFDKSTASLQNIAPNVTNSLNQSITRGVQFLASKIPQPATHFVLSKEYKPSPAAMEKFEHYYEIVNNPIATFEEIKDGVLSFDTMEALTAVHPMLLEEMKKSILENFDEDEAHKMPYTVKLALSKFIGQPLDENMQGSSIISYQASLSGPQLSQQGVQKDHVTQAGLKELDLAKTSKTQTDRDDES